MDKKQIALRVENVSKAYKLYKRKRDKVADTLKIGNSKRYDSINAVEQVSFELLKGESLAIVGRNGSGKSTLLQLICGTIKPDSGSIHLEGRIAALLELGSGFNPDFTGRENVYLNAILLGLSAAEATRKMEDIIDFAEIGEYFDQPLKTYSSGMIVRLAFAVVANVDADILIIDEALAVGDAYFTQKCMRYLQRFKLKKTLIFVSHDQNAVINLCDKALLMNRGKKQIIGNTKMVMEKYTRMIQESIEYHNDQKLNKKEGKPRERGKLKVEKYRKAEYISKWTDYRTEVINKSEAASEIKIVNVQDIGTNEESYGGETSKIINVRVKNLGSLDKEIDTIKGGELVELQIKCKAEEDIKSFICGFIIKNDKGLTILGDNTFNRFENQRDVDVRNGEEITTRFIFTIPMLSAGKYSITASIAQGDMERHSILHWINDAIILTSTCTNIGAGIAGVPMQSITIEREEK
tara:strand:- start:1364 stop:2761 length:1398 start_codon:yes stop_codon:yes gene_type:complete